MNCPSPMEQDRRGAVFSMQIIAETFLLILANDFKEVEITAGDQKTMDTRDELNIL